MQSNPTRRAERGLIVPAGEIEIYLACGWMLADEPGCIGARILPPPCFTRNSPLESSKNHRVSGDSRVGSTR
jgi:hypothetical protein